MRTRRTNEQGAPKSVTASSRARGANGRKPREWKHPKDEAGGGDGTERTPLDEHQREQLFGDRPDPMDEAGVASDAKWVETNLADSPHAAMKALEQLLRATVDPQYRVALLERCSGVLQALGAMLVRLDEDAAERLRRGLLRCEEMVGPEGARLMAQVLGTQHRKNDEVDWPEDTSTLVDPLRRGAPEKRPAQRYSYVRG